MQRVEQHIVPEGTKKERLSDYVCNIFESIPSRKGLKKAIKKGRVWVDGKKADTGLWVKAGQLIELYESDDETHKIYELKLDVIFEDEQIAVIRKPAGLVVSGNMFRTLQNALLYNIKVSSEIDALKLPTPVHRLDSATSGLILIAKTKRAQMNLSKQFQDKSIRKRYRAIVCGNLKECGKIDFPIDDKESLSEFKSVELVSSKKYEYLTLVDLFPHTGRTHQLRIHMAKYGHPILGDRLYNDEETVLKGKGLFLSAVEIEFKHPQSDELLKFCINTPNKFETMLKKGRG